MLLNENYYLFDEQLGTAVSLDNCLFFSFGHGKQ